MEIKVVINKDAIETHTETSLDASDVLVEGRPLSVACGNAFAGFSSKITSLRKDRKYIEFKRTANSAGETIVWVTVYSNATTSDVFTLFKSMGMYMPKITVGVNY